MSNDRAADYQQQAHILPVRKTPHTNHKAARHYIKWVRAYLECLFEHREVVVTPEHQRQLDLLLW